MKKLNIHGLALDLAECITNDLHHFIQKENFYPVRDSITNCIQGWAEYSPEDIAEHVTETLSDDDHISQDNYSAVYNAICESFREALSEIAFDFNDKSHDMAYGNLNDEIDAVNREMYG